MRLVTRGVAVGTLWAFVIPCAQTVAAAAHRHGSQSFDGQRCGAWEWLPSALPRRIMWRIKLIWRLGIWQKRRTRRAGP